MASFLLPLSRGNKYYVSIWINVFFDVFEPLSAVALQKRHFRKASVLSNLRISSNLESDASIRNRIFRIFDSNRRVEIRTLEFRIRIWVRSSRFGSDSVRMFEIRHHCLRVHHRVTRIWNINPSPRAEQTVLSWGRGRPQSLEAGLGLTLGLSVFAWGWN